ncbi:hypothetical protein C2G38_2196814 [Gigaspora rosea]|uniref:Uncharacterized protein n=1 Tax=Gigaspora rosea TaxID=44941 RepID=A0A397UVK2_9GLOM|nr:hypothetical protein C2G38_2196814 [Gigaspora rosea]
MCLEIHFKNLFHVYNIDNYHSIRENRRPDTTSTSTAKHFATCVAKPVFEYLSVPLIFNGVSIHNPANVELPRICWYLLKRYTGVFDISYLDYQSLQVSQGHLIITKYDQIELLTIHSYADNIIERKKEHSMNGLKLVGFKEQHLHSLQDYISNLNMILLVNNKPDHLTGYVAPIVADWPGQIFIRKALYMRTLPNLQNSFPQLAQNGWIKIKSKIIEKFGQTCKDIEYRMMIDLLDNLIPSTLDIYATLFHSGQFDAYVETKHLASFHEHYVENMHSRIRANMSHNATTDNIIKQAYVIMNHESTFKDTYSKARRYLYSIKTLDFLYDKTALFLLKHFQEVFYNCGISVLITTNEIDKEITEKITNETIKTNTKKTATTTTKKTTTATTKKATKKVVDKPTKQLNKKTTRKFTKKITKKITQKRKPEIYYLTTLKEKVDTRHLPMAYSTSRPPSPELCDSCKLPLNHNDIVLICGHGYHTYCYSGMCVYCEEFYKKGIFENVNSFLKRIEKGADTLTSEDLDDDENNIEENMEEQPEVEDVQDISSSLAIQIEQIESCLNEHVYMCILTVILKTNVLPKSRRQSNHHDGSLRHYFIALKKRIGKVPQQTADFFDVRHMTNVFLINLHV